MLKIHKVLAVFIWKAESWGPCQYKDVTLLAYEIPLPRKTVFISKWEDMLRSTINSYPYQYHYHSKPFRQNDFLKTLQSKTMLVRALLAFFIIKLLQWKIQIIHCRDVIMGAMASQITGLSIVYSTDYSGADKKKHQSSASLVFVLWIPRTKGQ